MPCKPDLDTLVSEIEWLVKNHSKFMLRNHQRLEDRRNSFSTSEDQAYTMNITLDIFAKLHQMLHNYIGLINFHGSMSRDVDCLKIPLNEALDVAVRAMISAMQSCVPKQRSSSPVCFNSIQTPGCSRCQSVDARTKCEFDKAVGIEEVDEKLERLKVMNLESVENVEAYIKDTLQAITKLPLAVMTNRLKILSSIVRNTKNKLPSCGRASEASLMGTQVNPISQLISEFILEYGQIKSQIFPCRKICRFCGSVICPTDRKRNVFCCENAKHLNVLWKEWTRQNPVKGVAKWDEDTIASIVDSLKDAPVEGGRCLPGAPCTIFCRTAGQRDSKPGHQDGEGKNKTNQPRDTNEHERNRISSHLSQGENQGVANRLASRGLRDNEGRNKIGRLGTRERHDNKDPAEESHSRAKPKQDKGKRRETPSHSSNTRSPGVPSTTKTSDVAEKRRKKEFKKATSAARWTGSPKNLAKNAGEVDLDDEDDNLGVGVAKKTGKSGKRDDRKTAGDPADKRQGKSQRKKAGTEVNTPGEFLEDSGDRRIGRIGKPSGVESPRKERAGAKTGGKGNKTSPHPGSVIPSEKGTENGAKGPDGLGRGRTDEDVDPSLGTKTREKYGEADGKRSSGEGREIKSGNGTHGDSENIIRYELSNDLFVELGWTLLPKDTIMRRVIEFQALLAKPHMNWFEKNKIHGKQYYPDEKTVFANFHEDGSGQVCYPDGQTAIAARISKNGTHELYKVYALEGRDIMGVVRPPRLMGVFDSMGNGVVYDENCDVRLTYNQNGGVYVDNPAKVPFSWGWNNFQTFPIDEAVYEDPSAGQLPPELIPARVRVENRSRKTSEDSKSSKARSSGKLSDDQSASGDHKSRNIESVKVTPHKVVTPLKPVCLKLNKYLSLRILDRKNINLQFFAGPRRVRIELGTEVDPNVQITSELVDHDDWTEKMTKSRFHLDLNKIGLNPSSPDNSVIEIAEEFNRVKNEAVSRQLMIAKYRPHLISSVSHTSPK